MVSLRCRSWLCPDCHPDRHRALLANAFAGRPDTFLTLTCRRIEGDDAEDRARALSNAWRILRKRCFREASRDRSKHPDPFGARPAEDKRSHAYGFGRNRVTLHKGKLPFLAVVEKTEAGWPHLHILLRAKWIDYQWLRAQMDELLRSPEVHVKRLYRRDVRTSYCVKYCGKATHKFDSTKRYWQSRDYDPGTWKKQREEEGPPLVWQERKTRIAWIAGEWIKRGWRVTFDGPWKATAEVPARAGPS